jgi:hypothetical protein
MKHGNKGQVLKDLKNLWNHFDFLVKIKAAKKYADAIREYFDDDVEFLIRLANDALVVAEQLNGSFYADLIEQHLYLAFKNISLGYLGSNQFASVKEVLLRYEDPDMPSKLHEIQKRISKNDDFGVQMLTSLLCSFKSLREVFSFIENELGTLVTELKSHFSVNDIIQLISLLNTFLITSELNIDGMRYKSSISSYFKHFPKVFDSIWEVIFIACEFEACFTKSFLTILEKCWTLFKSRRNDIFFIILKVLKKSKNMKNPEISEFLFKFFTLASVSPGQKACLKSEVPELFETEDFHLIHEKSWMMSELRVFDMFPLFADIEAGESFSLKFPVFQGDLGYIEFVLSSQSINFSVSSKKNLYFSQSNIEGSRPFCVKIAFHESEVVEMTWDNTFSWFQNKNLRFRVLVLRPDEKEVKISAFLKDEKVLVRKILKEINQVDLQSWNQRKVEGLKKRNLKVLINDYRLFQGIFMDFNCGGVLDVEVIAYFVSREKNAPDVLVLADDPSFRVAASKDFKLIVMNKSCIGSQNEIVEKKLENILEIFSGHLVFFFNMKNTLIVDFFRKKSLGFSVLDYDDEFLIREFEKFRFSN